MVVVMTPSNITQLGVDRSPWSNLTHFTVYKWNESGFRPPLCTYRLNWARRTSWGWWDDWDDTVLQDSKFEPWRSEAEHATSRSRRLPTILTFTRGWGRNIFVSFKPPKPGTEPRTLAWKAAVLATTLGPPPFTVYSTVQVITWAGGLLFRLSCCQTCDYCLPVIAGLYIRFNAGPLPLTPYPNGTLYAMI